MVYTIILNYNSSEETLGLLKNLKDIEVETKILVIDNNSDDLDKENLKAQIPPNQLIINKKNSGYAAGNNIGINMALKEGAEYIWILNPDIRVDKHSLSILLETIRSDKNIAAVGPRIIYREVNDCIFSDGGIILKDENCKTIHKNQHSLNSQVSERIDYDIDYIDGSCLLMSSRVLKQIDLFSEEYFLYFEETDWCMKAKQNKFTLAINSKSKAYNLNSKKGSIYHYYMMRNRLIFSKKFDLNYSGVRNFYLYELFMEFVLRFKGKYFKPCYISRVKGLIAGILKS